MDELLLIDDNDRNGSVSIPSPSNDYYDCLTGEQLKVIKRLVSELKIKAKDGPEIEQLYKSWSKLSSLCERIYSVAIEYCHSKNGQRGVIRNVDTTSKMAYNNNNANKSKITRYNGARSLIKIISKFVPHVQKAIDSGSLITDFLPSNLKPASKCEIIDQVTGMFIHLVEVLIDFFESPDLVNFTGKQSTMYLVKKYLEYRDKLTEGTKAYWSHYPAFWADEEAQWIWSGFSLLSASFSNLPYSLASLVSRSAHGFWQEGLFYSASPYYPLNLANYINNPLVSAVNRKSCTNSGLNITEIEVPRKTIWRIPSVDGKVEYVGDREPEANQKPIMCRLIRQEGLIPNGNIILHCQGGAFTVELPVVFDQCFRLWAPYLEGATIFDVTYSRFVRFPVQLQELLDVFLWLTNYEENDVASILGFEPKKIIFCGDSGGGLFLFTLSAILRDIQLISAEHNPPELPFPGHLYPKALVTFYPVLSLTFPSVHPSLILSFLEQFITPLTICNCLSLYSAGLIFDSDFTDAELTDSSHYLQPSRWTAFYNTWFNKKKIWLQCDGSEVHNRLDRVVSTALTPYKSPLIAYNLDLIKDLDIYLLVGEYDPFLDTNTEFSQIWPGKITLDVLDDLSHGFLAFTWLSKKSRSAARLCLERILEALKD